MLFWVWKCIISEREKEKRESIKCVQGGTDEGNTQNSVSFSTLFRNMYFLHVVTIYMFQQIVKVNQNFISSLNPSSSKRLFVQTKDCNALNNNNTPWSYNLEDGDIADLMKF